MAIKDLTGNLGGGFPYSALAYGLGDYSQVEAFALAFSAALTVVSFSPVALGGDLALELALQGVISFDPPPFDGDLAPIVTLAADMISGPLWAPEACPPTQWTPAEPCPASLWTSVAPGAVTWKKTEKCNG